MISKEQVDEIKAMFDGIVPACIVAAVDTIESCALTADGFFVVPHADTVYYRGGEVTSWERYLCSDDIAGASTCLYTTAEAAKGGG